MTAARRERLKLVVSEQAETKTIERILRLRLRERRELRIAREGRQAHRIKEAAWISVDRALEIEGTIDPTRLRMEIKAGLPARYQHRTKWWEARSIEQVAPLLAGRNPLDLQDERWELVVHERYWRKRLDKRDVSSSAADVPLPATEKAQLQAATNDDIRVAMRAVYDEKGNERPDTKKIVPLVRARLEAGGLYAKWRAVSEIAREREFEERRNPPGPTRKSPKNRPE